MIVKALVRDLADRAALGDGITFVRTAGELAGADVAVVDLTLPGVVDELPSEVGRIVGYAPHVASDLLAVEGVEAVPRSRFFRDPRQFIFQKQ